MKILVTGATGFIGKHLLPILAKDHEVLALTRSEILPVENVKWIKIDLGDCSEIDSLPASDVVVHMAQSEFYREFPEKSKHVFDINVASTARLLEYASKCGCKQFIFASTGSVYEPYDGNMSEVAPVFPSSFYSCSKLAAESLVGAYSSLFKVALLRLFFPYGPGQTGKLIPNLANTLESGKAVDLYGDAEGMNFTPIYIDDVVSSILLAISDEWQGIINVAGDELVSLKSVVDTMALHMGVEATYNHHPGEVLKIDPDTTKLRSLRKGQGFLSFEEGFQRSLGAHTL